MRKTNRRSWTNPHNTTLSEPTRRSNTGKKQTIMVNNQHIIMSWCTIKYDACPVKWSMAWQSAQTILQIKWTSICNSVAYWRNTTFKLFSSILFMYPKILNVVKHGKWVKQSKTTYLVKFKWGRKQRTTIPETRYMHILGLVLFCPKHNFRVV